MRFSAATAFALLGAIVAIATRDGATASPLPEQSLKALAKRSIGGLYKFNLGPSTWIQYNFNGSHTLCIFKMPPGQDSEPASAWEVWQSGKKLASGGGDSYCAATPIVADWGSGPVPNPPHMAVYLDNKRYDVSKKWTKCHLACEP